MLNFSNFSNLYTCDIHFFLSNKYVLKMNVKIFVSVNKTKSNKVLQILVNTIFSFLESLNEDNYITASGM